MQSLYFGLGLHYSEILMIYITIKTLPRPTDLNTIQVLTSYLFKQTVKLGGLLDRKNKLEDLGQSFYCPANPKMCSFPTKCSKCYLACI